MAYNASSDKNDFLFPCYDAASGYWYGRVSEGTNTASLYRIKVADGAQSQLELVMELPRRSVWGINGVFTRATLPVPGGSALWWFGERFCCSM